MAIGRQSQAGKFPLSLGLQPSSPLLGISVARPNTPSRKIGFGLKLPSSEALDYAHKLTTTTLLMIGLVAFLVLARGKPRAAIRGILRKHVAEV